MNEQADTWQMELTQLTWEFDKLANEYDLTTLNQRPNPENWSPMEILHHLVRVNESYFPIFDQIIQGKYKSPLLGNLPFYGKKMGEMILSANKKPVKIKTFARWEPTAGMHNQDLLNTFFETQHLLSVYIQKLDPYFNQKQMIASPANKWIVYPLDTTIEIMLTHEKRHCDQIKSILVSE
ncbi:DinB family protein [Cyclobacterium jeungdonense]|uniref:DinB family protein n=1 Tax=Cyclobacterium jeungdonense TaxID=708087 RepID=A0ABT8CFY0_9BACT|nr:DinB family protein [Cyclobacterium jeungdonense]MDN3690693.1 DinB family protein [Cyclobacterium jeungdonense]